MTYKEEDLMICMLRRSLTGRAGRNTRIAQPENHGPLVVELHGNPIAAYCPATESLHITDAGWQTTTTKSRLNALLDAFAPGYGLSQRGGEWMLTVPAGHGDSLTPDKRPWHGVAQFRDGVCIAS